MKKFVTLALMFAMLLSLAVIPVSADGQEISALNFVEVSPNSISKADDGIYIVTRYGYAGYGEIDLTGMNSIEIKALHDFNLNKEGEVFWIRIDDPKGRL